MSVFMHAVSLAAMRQQNSADFSKTLLALVDQQALIELYQACYTLCGGLC